MRMRHKAGVDVDVVVPQHDPWDPSCNQARPIPQPARPDPSAQPMGSDPATQQDPIPQKQQDPILEAA